MKKTQHFITYSWLLRLEASKILRTSPVDMKVHFILILHSLWRISDGLPVTSEGTLYIAPTRILSPWKTLSPEAIDCRSSVGRRGLELTASHKKITTYKWTPHMTLPTSGFSCYGLGKSTRCSRSFFGYDSLERTSYRYLPSPTACLEQYQKYRENHPMGVEFPFPSCHWMGEDIEKSEGIIIALNPVEYDPFVGAFRDHLLAEGLCHKAPCITNDRKAYWFNVTSPTQECRNEPEFEIYIPDSAGQTSVDGLEFVSIGLQARTFKGACRVSYCNEPGILLHTREWIHISRSMANRFPKINDTKECYNKSAIYAYQTQTAVIAQVINEYQYDQLFERCKKIQDRLILGEAISRTDLQYLVPTSFGRGPVYRFINNTIQVASAVYEVCVFPEDNAGAFKGYTIGKTLNHSDPILWTDPVRVTDDIVDGPNGMFWFRGRLIYPGKWSGRIREITQHLTKSVLYTHVDKGHLDHDVDKEMHAFDGVEHVSPWLLQHVAHLSLLESILFLVGSTVCLVVIFKCIQHNIKKSNLPVRFGQGNMIGW